MSEIDKAYIKHMDDNGYFIPDNNLEPYRKDGEFVGFQAGWKSCTGRSIELLHKLADSFHRSDMSFSDSVNEVISFLDSRK